MAVRFDDVGQPYSDACCLQCDMAGPHYGSCGGGFLCARCMSPVPDSLIRPDRTPWLRGECPPFGRTGWARADIERQVWRSTRQG